jgi:hypothetical protein
MKIVLDDNLIGRWATDERDEQARSRYGETALSFGRDGSLTYEIKLPDGRSQVANMTYRVEPNGVMVTDQPSAPSEQRTRYSIDPSGGRLMLEFNGQTSWYVRVGQALH